MYHKHHANRAVVGVLIGVLLVGGLSAGAGALVRSSIFSNANASVAEKRAERIQRRKEERIIRASERRQARLEARKERMRKQGRLVSDIDRTYPMQTNLFSGEGGEADEWELTLGIGTVEIDHLGISVPIHRPSLTYWNSRNWRGLEQQMQVGLNHGSVVYPHSVAPGQNGSVILAGHSSPPTVEAMASDWGNAFKNLPQIKIGDRIKIKDEDGTIYEYEVRETKVMHPTETSILLQNPTKKSLTMFTCYPVGTTLQRFGVFAELVI